MSKRKKFDLTMFEKLTESLNKPDTNSGGSFSNIMKFPAGHTYTIRLIPDVDNVDNTFFHHYIHSWTSVATGKFISALSLQTFNESDPIANLRWKLYKAWKDANPNPGVDEQGKKITFKSPIDQKENWFVNAYWVDNPDNEELNGTVQIFKVGPQIKEIIDQALTGDRSDEFGISVFDLGKGGCDLKIVAEKQGEFTTFKKSYFKVNNKLELTDDEIDGIYENVHDLKSVYSVKTSDELVEMLNEHYFGQSEKREAAPQEKKSLSQHKAAPVQSDEDPDDEIPMFHESDATRVVEEVQKPKTKSTKKGGSNIDDIIAGLNL